MTTFDKPDQPGTNGHYGGGTLTPASRWTNENYVNDLKEEIQRLQAERDTLQRFSDELLKVIGRHFGSDFSASIILSAAEEANATHLLTDPSDQ